MFLNIETIVIPALGVPPMFIISIDGKLTVVKLESDVPNQGDPLLITLKELGL